MTYSIIHIVLALFLQYTLVTLLHIKKPELLEQFGVIPWFPIIGPIAIVTTLVVLAMFAAPFMLPLAIANGLIWLINRFVPVAKHIDYII